MKRDFNLIRAILLALEENETVIGFSTLEIDGVTEEQVSYHVRLLFQAGLIDALDASAMNSFHWLPGLLTWDGHEFLDASRDETRWKSAQNLILEKGGDLGFDVLKDVLVRLSRQGLEAFL